MRKQITQTNKDLMQGFMSMRNMAELKALSKHSLGSPLNDAQYNKIMELEKKVFKKTRGGYSLR